MKCRVYYKVTASGFVTVNASSVKEAIEKVEHDDYQELIHDSIVDHGNDFITFHKLEVKDTRRDDHVSVKTLK